MEIDIINMISTVGFPIAACCAMFWLYTKMLPIITTLSENMKDVKETMDKVNKSLDLFNENFTEIFRRLASLEAYQKKDK